MGWIRDIENPVVIYAFHQITRLISSDERYSPEKIEMRWYSRKTVNCFLILLIGKFQTDPSDMIIESDSDLRQFNVFIFKKLMKLESNKKKRDTRIDAIFKKAFKEFHMEIISYEAVVSVRSLRLYIIFVTYWEIYRRIN